MAVNVCPIVEVGISHGRIKDIIVTSNGKNINPEEIENILVKQYPCIKEVAVLSVKGVLSAIIVPEMNAVRDAASGEAETVVREAVLDYNKNAVAYKHIRKIHVVSVELPKTKLGKLQRFLLEPLLEKVKNEDSENTKCENLGETFDLLKQFVESETESVAKADSHFEIDIFLTSLKILPRDK